MTPLTLPSPAGAKPASPKRRRPRIIPRSYGRKLGLLVFAVLSGALAYSVLTDGGRRATAMGRYLPDPDQLLYWTGLRIDQVAVTGQRFTSDADIFDALDLPNARSLVSFDIAAARARIERLPWIAAATISRAYPSSLEIRVSERTATALWLRGGREYLIDKTGRVLTALKPGTHNSLPRIAGEGAATEAQAFLDLVARYPVIAERFLMAERIGERRWTLRLRNGVTVHLAADGEANAFEELSSASGLGQLLAGHDLIVDVRSRDRITVRPDPPEAAPHAGQS